jgi:PAS domain S-box-containing protein
LFRQLPCLIGALTTALGLAVIIGWFAHWPAVLQILPNLAPMKFNTALDFILCGTSLVLLTTGRTRIVPWLGGLTMLISVLTLLEYLTGYGLGIDQLFVNDYIFTATAVPGRMSPLACSCFTLLGAALMFARSSRRPWRLTVVGLLTCMVGMVAFVALFGYLFRIEAAYGWGAYTRMALHTAAAFFLLSLGFLIWAWQTARQENYSFLRWLPVAGAATLMFMVAFISIVNMAELKDATAWRKHTYEAISAAESFQDGFIAMQRNAHGYVTMGTPELLATYRSDTNIWSEKFNHLVRLTSDNPSQRLHLKAILGAMQAAVAYNDRIIGIYQRSGSQAVLTVDATGEGRTIVGHVLDGMKVFIGEEQRLMDKRDAREQSNYRSLENLLVFGSMLAGILLVVANYMASHELMVRRRVEVRLSETLTLQNAILDSANYAITAMDARGFLQTFNPAAERMLGYTAAEVIGKTTPLLWRDPKEVEARAEKLSRELGRPVKPDIEIITSKPANTKAEEYEATFIRKDGSRFPVLISLTTLADASGTVTGFLGVVADVTARKKAEAALRLSEERFRSAFDGAPIGMSLVSPQGRWLKVNHALCNMIGHSEAELLATDFQHVTHPDDLAKDLDFVQQLLAGKILSYQMEKRYLHKDGSHVSVMLSVSLIHDRDGDPLYFVAQIENITERKQHEAEREKLIAELQAALVEVKTLSGMIPICGWCKNVRNDKGYWSTVEQYVRTHTEATFSHGMCPDCAQKFQADIFKANARPDAA